MQSQCDKESLTTQSYISMLLIRDVFDRISQIEFHVSKIEEKCITLTLTELIIGVENNFDSHK